MKAIEILKEYNSIDYDCDMSDLHNRIEEAIAELEELENRSCKNCKFSIPIGNHIICSNKVEDELNHSEFKKDFYCKYWEAK